MFTAVSLFDCALVLLMQGVVFAYSVTSANLFSFAL
ncbi:hypothetical protein M8C21_030009 [Ambrosia artemisiifolia]|uniref:Uncharacterized protein n=1 Tax=Ambrosia artemisiifolia TaxID=4212 RepID=A0AAD5GLN0_AMBAR|nr:hypothetical protein M8C21_030009 [Ambrosia artemisiifolia]